MSKFTVLETKTDSALASSPSAARLWTTAEHVERNLQLDNAVGCARIGVARVLEHNQKHNF